MTLPAGVSVASAGRLEFVTQRGYWAGRRCQVKLCSGKCCGFTSCMFAALASLLVHAGYRLPLDRKLPVAAENFVLSLHKASGASLGSGSNIGHSQRALRRLLPDAPVLFGALTDTELVEELVRGAAIRLHVLCGKLPRSPKRWVGQGYSGGHAVTVVGIRIVDGAVEVFWLDPMGKPAKGYAGEWVRLADVDQAIKRNAAGKMPVTLTYRDAAVPAVQPEPVPDPTVQLRATIAKLESAITVERSGRAKAEARVAIVDSAAGYLVGDLEAAITRYRERTA